MTFGEKVKEARLLRNLSQTELAAITGISERSLYTYEQLNTLPRKSNIKKVADAFNVSVSYLWMMMKLIGRRILRMKTFSILSKTNSVAKVQKRQRMC